MSSTPQFEKPYEAAAGDSNRELTGDHDEFAASPGQKRNKKLIALGIVGGAIVVIVLAVVLPVYFVVIKPQQLNSTGGGSAPSTGGSASPSGGGNAPAAPTIDKFIGRDGSEVTTEDGSKFTYSNKFGGYWFSNPADPFNNYARAQADVPPLNATWKWGVDMIQGVNLGGWLVLEPFISPALFMKYNAVDEYTLSLAMRADTAGGGINQLEEHYKTFITEKDFAEIAGAGLNWIRLPIPYWAIEVFDGEPFLEGVSWKYVLKAFGWARKYGLRINLDLHAVPGSQNPWWHSGRLGTPNPSFLYGPMGYANAQRTLDYIRIITEFISQDEYKNLVPMFGVINEPLLSTLTRPELERFYYQAHQTVRSVTGLGAGQGPYISFHDGFGTVPTWYGFLNGADRMAMDHHPYFAFSGGSTDPFEAFITRACDGWGSMVNTSMSTFGMTTAGEWSLAWNDCGLYVNGVNGRLSYPGDCAPWNDWQSWTPAIKDNMRLFALNQMSALQNQFFWTWKIGPPLGSTVVAAPLWSYKLGLDNGWMPTNPREARGVCPSVNPFSATQFQPWQVGGAGAGQITTGTGAYEQWPPATAQYLFAPNRPIPKLQPAPVPAGVTQGDGWTNDADVTLAVGPNPGCQYPNAYAEGGGPITLECRPDGQAPVPVPVPATPTPTVPGVPTETATTEIPGVPTPTTDPTTELP